MHLPSDIFLALRYLKPRRTFLSLITLLTILGPLLGVGVLIIVRSVMNGFDRDIRTGIMNMQAHITIYPSYGYEYFRNPQPIINRLEQEPYGIKATPVIETTGLLQLRNSVFPKVIRGIDPSQDYKVTKIQANFFDQQVSLQEGQVVIGYRMALQNGLQSGDDFLIHSPARLTSSIKWNSDGTVDMSAPDEMYLPEQVRIATFYEMGIADYDDNIIIMHQDQVADLLGIPWGAATSIQCSVPDPLNMTGLMTELRNKYSNLRFISWQEQNAMLFSTLQVEQNLMTFLLAFIVIVASFSIASTLITVAVQKTREIGILKAVGLSRMAIARIFLFEGAIIGIVGTLLGTATGLLVLKYRDFIAKILSFIMGHDVFPAELYHLTRIPALTNEVDLFCIVTGSIAICIIAALLPALYASSFSPATALKTDN